MALRQYSTVRVKQLLRPADDYDGWNLNQRAPIIGDVGTLIDILHAPGGPDLYLVEMSNPVDGVDIWLSEIALDELEQVDGG